MFGELGGAGQSRRLLVELHGVGDQFPGMAVRVLDRDDVSIGAQLLVLARFDTVLDWRPLTLQRAEGLAPFDEGASSQLRSEDLRRLLRVFHQAVYGVEARVVSQLWPADVLAEIAPVPAGLEKADVDPAAIRGSVIPGQRVCRRRRGACTEWRDWPRRAREQRNVDCKGVGPRPDA